MEIFFQVSQTNEGGYTARAPGHSLVANAATWDELRSNAVAAAILHFKNASIHPNQIRMHFVKDEVIAAGSALPIEANGVDSWFQAFEPNRATASELHDILAVLSAREPIFHRPEFGTTRADFERMTVEDYWETGASGRRYSRQAVLDGLEERFAAPHDDVWETSEFACRRLGEDTYLLTYTLLQDRVRMTRRATIWRKTLEGWKIVYHQGTLVEDDSISNQQQPQVQNHRTP